MITSESINFPGKSVSADFADYAEDVHVTGEGVLIFLAYLIPCIPATSRLFPGPLCVICECDFHAYLSTWLLINHRFQAAAFAETNSDR